MVLTAGDPMIGDETTALAGGPMAVSLGWREAPTNGASTPHDFVACDRKTGARGARTAFGFSLVELMVVTAIMAVLFACALPLTKGIFNVYRLRAAATTAAMAIESNRYHAIMQSYPYQIAFSATTNSYQVLSEVPPANTFSNVGGPIPLDPGGTSTISATMTFQFSPGGIVTLVGGTMPATFTVTNSSGTKTITVSSVGNVTVTP